MIYVELVKGKIRISKDAKKAHIFRHTDIDKMAKFLGPASLTDHWMTSSSVNHQHEEGFSKSFDIDPVLTAVRRRILDMAAVVAEPGPALGAAARIIQLTKGMKFPGSIRFVRTDDSGDISLDFSSEDELCTFLNGVRYAEKLLKLESAKPTEPEMKAVRVKRRK